MSEWWWLPTILFMPRGAWHLLMARFANLKAGVLAGNGRFEDAFRAIDSGRAHLVRARDCVGSRRPS